MTFTITRRATLAAGCALALSALPALAADWPNAPVHIVVGFPAGSSPDTLARLVAEPLAKALGQPVVVDNKAGAGGVIGVGQVAAASDGHTFGVTINGPLTTAQRLVPGLSYDPATDLAPVTLLATSPMVLVLNNQAEPTDLSGFVDWARAHPGEVSYGSVGQGSGAHLTMELFAQAEGLDLLHIPFQSYAEVTNAMIGQEVNAAFMAPSGALAQYKAGKLKVLGITSGQPSDLAPDVPVMAGQAGLPGDFRAELWNAVIAPAGTDSAVIERLNTEINTILQDPDLRQKMLEIGWQAQGGSAQDLQDRITADTALWGAVIDKTGLAK
ncbi:Bug family tripartite tricarboxylate transporter substrate binding protein [Paracoccus jiaweipingae]|uniref:Bug family tripartite tricarboxylate transporter substrate binding protein n=1 Tax=unclassified Paracoccus (in: a-proteobacteria) TaxID=2688777 RepID=UPI00379EBD49